MTFDTPALPLMAGALASALILTGSSTLGAIVAAATILAAIICSYKHLRRGLLWLATGIALTVTSLSLSIRPHASVSYMGEHAVEATVLSCNESTRSINAVVDVKSIDGKDCSPFRLRLSSDQGIWLQRGDIVRFTSAIESCYKYYIFIGDTNYPLTDKAQRISGLAHVPSQNIRIVGHEASIASRLDEWRRKLARAIYSSPLDPATSSFIVAACFGTGDADIDIKERFRHTGLSHLLCVSGFHVAVLAWIVLMLLWPLKLWTGAGRARYLLLIALVWLFTLFTGAQPSAIRAATMLSAYYAARLINRQSAPANSLYLAVAIIIISNPYVIYSVGFQLSVFAVAGLIVFAEALNPVPLHYFRAHQSVAMLCVPLAAIIATAPIVLFWFHRLPLLSVPVNAIVTLLLPLLLISAGAAVMFSSAFMAHIADSLFGFILRLCDATIAHPLSTISDIRLSPTAMAALILTIVVFALMLHTRSWRWRLAIMPLLVIATAMAIIPADRPEVEAYSMADDNSSYCIVRHGTACHVYTSGTTIPSYLQYAAINADIDSIACSGQRHFKVFDKHIGIASKAGEPADKVDVLLIDGSYPNDINSLIARLEPSQVLIGAKATPLAVQTIKAACRARSIAYHDLNVKAVAIE